jgi:hypothetical protein
MDQDKDIYHCLDWRGQSSWGMMKEAIIQLASLPVAADELDPHGWYMILTKGAKMPYPDNRRYTAFGYRDLAIYRTQSGRPMNNPTSNLEWMLGSENDPYVLTAILECILTVLGIEAYTLPYEAKKKSEAFAKFSQIVKEHYQHISEVVAQISKSNEHYKKPIQTILEVVGENL